MADLPLQESAGAPDEHHQVKNTWTTAWIVCGACGEGWEQPNYTDDEIHWVCPHCIHAATTARAAKVRAAELQWVAGEDI